MKKIIFLMIPLAFIFLAANPQAQSEKKAQKEHEHSEAVDTSKAACCSGEEAEGECCSNEAADGKADAGHKKPDKVDQEAKQAWNTVCPVTGEDIEEGAPTLEYNGKIVAFCCKGCVSKFQKDPEKYLKDISPDGKTYLKKD